ncbi:MAG: Lrp/AsnC ligand binding domain-containing protein [Steroidobacteraceae bacterium]|nr:Lrp/AsnC ligand binding domain-containing protein [Steroidobacteraceae bacterium]
MEQQLDRLDRRLLDLLQRDGRLAVAELARRIHLSPTPCLERVRRLERLGYITGYAAHLNPEPLGLRLLAFVQVQLDRTTPDVFDVFKRVMIGLDEVLECHMVAGGFDYLVKLRVPDMDAYRRFLGERLATIPGVQQTHTYFVMEEVKSTHLLAVPPSA